MRDHPESGRVELMVLQAIYREHLIIGRTLSLLLMRWIHRLLANRD